MTQRRSKIAGKPSAPQPDAAPPSGKRARGGPSGASRAARPRGGKKKARGAAAKAASSSPPPSVPRDRIKDFRRVRGAELVPNPKNWRTHPTSQAAALRDLLGKVGFADAVLARETPEGLMLLDGHLRAELSPDALVPVLVLDVDEREADLILATHDAVTEMAEIDSQRLDALLRDLAPPGEALESLLADLADQAGLYSAALHGAEALPPELKLEPIWQVLVECQDESQQREVYERLRQEGYFCRALTL